MGNEKTMENGITVKGATLLTAEEAEKLPEETRAIGCWWWLRSPGSVSVQAACVAADGTVSCSGNLVSINRGAVRPVLELSKLESSSLNIGDRFQFGKKEFEIISDTCALCAESVGHCAFRDDWRSKNVNNYETSDIKKFVDQWYEKTLKKHWNWKHWKQNSRQKTENK